MGKMPAPFEKAPHDTEYWLQQINRASIVCNVESGLLDVETARRLRAALNTMREEAAVPGFQRRDFYIHFEPRMLELAGVEASIVHCGRSSQDILATANSGENHERLLTLAQSLVKLCEVLIDAAKREKDAIVPAYTNGVQAQPELYSHYLLAHKRIFTRDLERIVECYRRYGACPMGSGVCNGTGWALNNTRMAELLGFSGPGVNAFDVGQCMGNDLPLESSQIVTAVMLHINAFLADYMQQYAQPRPWIQSVSKNGVYHSSSMPQKRNPGFVNDLRRDAGIVMGVCQGVMLRMQNLTIGQPDVRDSNTMGELFADANIVVRAFASFVETIRVDVKRALEELNADWTCTQEIADTLMRDAGIDFRTGHGFASHYVTYARANGKTPVNSTYEDFCRAWALYAEEKGLDKTFPLTPEELAHATDPHLILQNRKTIGSSSTLMIDAQIRAEEERLNRDREWIRIYGEEKEQAAEALEAALNAI